MTMHAQETLITTDSLVDTGRTPRRPMLAWLGDLMGKVDHVENLAVLRAGGDFSSVQNNFSLLVMLVYGTAAARQECISQIGHAIAERANGEAIQPWVNLARLDRIDGDARASAKKLSYLLRLARRGRAIVAGATFGSGRDNQRFASSVYASAAPSSNPGCPMTA